MPFVVIGIALLALSASAFVLVSGLGKPKVPSTQPANLVNQQKGTMIPRRIIYGRQRVGGILAYVETNTAGNVLNYIMIWGEGPIQAVEAILFNGLEVPLDGSGNGTSGGAGEPDYTGLVKVRSSLGAVDQGPLADAVAAMTGWPHTSVLLGVAYSWIQMTYNGTVFVNGVPDISAIIQGRNDLLDPRDNSLVYATNCALCLNHYLTLTRYGSGIVYPDEMDVPQLINAANVCDEDVAVVGGGTEAQYTYNGVITLDEDGETIITSFRTAMVGVCTYIGGKWRIYPGVWVEPTFTIDKSMLVDNVTTQNKISKRDMVNTIQGTYAPAELNWQQTSFPAVYDLEFLAQDGQELTEQVDFTPIQSASACQRIAMIMLQQARLTRSVQIVCNVKALRAQPGLPVFFNMPEIGYDNVPMTVVEFETGVKNNAIMLKMTLRETSEASFNWDVTGAQPFFQPPPLTVENPSIIQQPTGFAIAYIHPFATTPDGQATLSWDDPLNTFITFGQVQYQFKLHSSGSWGVLYTIPGDNLAVLLDGLTDSTFYDYQMRFVTSKGAQSQWTSLTNVETPAAGA